MRWAGGQGGGGCDGYNWMAISGRGKHAGTPRACTRCGDPGGLQLLGTFVLIFTASCSEPPTCPCISRGVARGSDIGSWVLESLRCY